MLLVAALAGCGGGGKTPTTAVSHGKPPGLLRGTVTLGPTSPVCRKGTPCQAPASGPLVFTRNGRVIAGIAVKEDGSYSVSLPPGIYAVALATQQPGIGRPLQPNMVRVVSGRTRNVDFLIDTGIR